MSVGFRVTPVTRLPTGSCTIVGTARAYFEADSDSPTAAWPAARRAVSTR
jgi:hypothetical protein